MKLLFLLFSLFKYAKFGKFMLTGGSMLLSMVAYAWIFGWPYAVGFVLLIFVHEMGHVFAARMRGLQTGAPAFIPFVGAWIQLKEQPTDVETEAFVGIAGPILGTLGAFVCYLAADGQSGLLLALAYAGFMINLFNLIPVSPMDGGRVLAVVSPKIWGVGLLALVGLAIYHPNPVLFLIAVMAIPRVFAAWKGTLQEPPGYYAIRTAGRAKYLVQYLALLGFLVFMTSQLHAVLPKA